jgi:hypothetical protein
VDQRIRFSLLGCTWNSSREQILQVEIRCIYGDD